MFNYEFEKYLCNKENIKETLNNYGIAICPILNENECNIHINLNLYLICYVIRNHVIIVFFTFKPVVDWYCIRITNFKSYNKFFFIFI